MAEVVTEVIAEIVIKLTTSGLGCRLQIQPVMPVVQAWQGLGETSQHLSRTELVWTELVWTEPVWTKLVQTELVQTELMRTELVRIKLVQTELEPDCGSGNL